MQTKKRAKPVKFGKAAKEAEQKAPVVEEPKEAAPAPEAPAVKETPEPTPPAEHTPQQGGELVDKLSDVPFETDFGTPSTAPEQHETPAAPAAPAAPATPAPSAPEPVSFTATSTNPTESAPATDEQPKTDSPQPVSAPIDVTAESTLPPIGRANEPIPFNPHETVFNTPPDAGEKKKNPFLYFLIIALVAFVTGIAFMAGIYYAMPDKNFFAMPSVPSIPGTAEPTPTPAPVAKATATPAPEVKLADYKVRVLNGSGVSGLAAKVKASLEAEGFTVTSIGNADRNDVVKTQVTYKKTVSKAAVTKVTDTLKKTYALDKETELPTTAAQEADITVTIGKETAK